MKDRYKLIKHRGIIKFNLKQKSNYISDKNIFKYLSTKSKLTPEHNFTRIHKFQARVQYN